MLRLIFFPSSWHYGIFKLYYPRLFVFKSLWKSCVIIVSSITLFFDGLPAQAKVFHILVDVPLNVMWTWFQSCASLVMNAWLLVYPITPTFCLSLIHFLTLLHTHFGLSHRIITHLSHCQYGHTIDGLVSTWFGTHVGVNAV
jgi:hypothetical protein